MPKFQINRRKFLDRGGARRSGLALSGCDAFDGLGNRDNAVRKFIEGANNLTYRVQRLLRARGAGAGIYGERHPPAAAAERRHRARRRHLQGTARAAISPTGGWR